MYYVYKLLIKNELVYIGKTKNLKARINAHKCDTKTEWKSKIDRIEYAITSSESVGSLYEIYYINKYKPKYNKQFANKTDGREIVKLKEIGFYDYKGFKSNDSYEEVLNIKQNVLAYILLLYKFSDLNGNIRTKNNKPVKTMSDIGELLDISRKTMSRNVKELKDIGMLDVRNNTNEIGHSITFNLDRFNELFG